jgi:hypothetical protein
MKATNQSADGAWRSARPSEGVLWLSAVRRPWWVAGGWALDLFVGSQSRTHKDLDIGILRRDVLEITSVLSSWQFFEAKGGQLTRLDAGKMPRADVNSLWGRPADTMDWELELMLDESDDDRWVFRRDASIRRPLATAVRHSSEGIPYLAPEIQLLYKARTPRAQDQADFEQVLPRMDAEARTWLHWVLNSVDPSHKWISALESTFEPARTEARLITDPRCRPEPEFSGRHPDH